MTKEELKRANEIITEIKNIDIVLDIATRDMRYSFRDDIDMIRTLHDKMVIYRLNNVLRECKYDLEKELEEL